MKKKLKVFLPLLLVGTMLTGCGESKKVCTASKGSLSSDVKVEMINSFDGNPKDFIVDFKVKVAALYSVDEKDIDMKKLTKNMEDLDKRELKGKFEEIIKKYFAIKGVKKDDVLKHSKVSVKLDRKHKEYIVHIESDLEALYGDSDYTIDFDAVEKDMKKLLPKTKCSK